MLYDYDGNAILFEAIKDRSGESIANAWKKCHKRLTANGHETKMYILDNEMSPEIRYAFSEAKVEFQKVLPGIHRRNACKRAIRTLKGHLLAGLATCSASFPVRKWDRLLQQAELTVNLLRDSRINPKLSAWAYLFGIHDFNRVPLCPPGTRTMVHLKSDKRKSWAFHGEDGFYVGPRARTLQVHKMLYPKDS